MLGIIKETKPEFYQAEAVTSDDLKLMAESSAYHLWAKKFAADRPRSSSRMTDDRVQRMAIHSLILEPDEFPYQYAVVPDGVNRQSKAGKEFFAEIEAEGRFPLKPEHYDEARLCAAAALANPTIRYVLSLGGQHDASLYWEDALTGVVCKARPYFMVEPCKAMPNGLIMSLHTCESAAEADFARAADTYGYNQRAEWECRGFRHLFGTDTPPVYVFAALERSYPFATNVWPVGAEAFALAAHENSATLDDYADCLKRDNWPAFNVDLKRPLPLPAFRLKEYNELFGEK